MIRERCCRRRKRHHVSATLLLGMVLAIMVLVATPTLAVPPEPYLVKDINEGPDGSSPYGAAFNGIYIFSADDGVHGSELWMSDGTSAGTVLLKDINSGSGDSGPGTYGGAVISDTLYFSADDGIHGRELWRTDGTEQGTVMVKDINPGGNDSYPARLVALNGVLVFAAEEVTHGRELWVSDGTEIGTMLLQDIRDGSDGSRPMDWSSAEVSDTLFFDAQEDVHGRELWRTDGTPDGTVMVADIRIPGDSEPKSMYDHNGMLFFAADDGVHGEELWNSDGTEPGTVRVKDINPGLEASWPSEFASVGNTLFFGARDGTHGKELWKTDGTEPSTVMVKDIQLGSGWSDPDDCVEFNGILFFVADDGVHGEELWTSDGTELGTELFMDINPGASGSEPWGMMSVYGILYFTADDGSHGRELWRSDGTPEGTVLVKDINPGPNQSSLEHLRIVEDKYFMDADDGTHGRELWVLDLPSDLVIQKSVTPETTVGPGMPVTYTLSFSNAGPIAAAGVVISDVIPPELLDLAYVNAGAAITPTGMVSYAWQVADLEPDDGGIITITGVVDPLATGVFSLTNAALITSARGDMRPGDNTSAVTITVDAEPPLPPELLSPMDGSVVTDTTPTLMWQPSPSSDVAGYLLDLDATVVDVGDVTNYTTGILFEGDHAWTLAAYDLLGNTGIYTDVWKFAVCRPVLSLELKRVPQGELFTGSRVRFMAKAKGTTPFTYAWTLDGVPVGENLSRFDYRFEAAGVYVVGVVVSNAFGQGDATLVVQVHERGPTQPDLSPSNKSVNVGNESGAEVLTYTLFLRNESTVEAEAILTDPIPPGTAYVPGSASASDGNPVELMDGSLTWSGQVISGTPVVVEFATVVQVAPAGTPVTNTAYLDDGLGNVSALEVMSVYLPDYWLVIDGGSLATNIPTVTLDYSWSLEDDITHVIFSNDEGFGPGIGTTDWIPVDPEDPTYADWVLSIYGQWPWPYTVYAKFRDSAGRPYGPIQDSITYDPDRPPAPGVTFVVPPLQSQTVIEEVDVIVRVTAIDANSGVDRVQISHSAMFDEFSEFAFVGPATDIPWALQSSGEVYVRAVDRAGNLSPITGAQGPARYSIYLPVVLRNAP
jgi:uncharacterized repeat protein (TIGR01451 family)